MEELTKGSTYTGRILKFKHNADRFTNSDGNIFCDLLEVKIDGHDDTKNLQILKIEDMSMADYKAKPVINFLVKAYSKQVYTIQLLSDKKNVAEQSPTVAGKNPDGSTRIVNPLPSVALTAAVKFHGDICRVPKETQEWEDDVISTAGKFLQFLRENQ